MQKTFIAVCTLFLGLGLVGCGHQQQASPSSSSKKTSQQTSINQASQSSSRSSKIASSTSDASHSTTKQPLWSNAKSAKLATFMASWSKTMGQQYESYWQGHSVDMYGLKIPDELGQAGTNQPGSMAMAVGDKAVTWALSTNGKSNAEYTIVAIYSDAAHEPYLGKHVYLFTLHNGQPEVLVTQQNQGNDNNWLYFSETQNQELRLGFAKIVQGD
ncbi:DUF4767 domain-containing protein [Lacticaseibacillus paracasei]|uniref:DUF4767 domain-containing protein n=1 Tax=Lacticaseibacillus paracasei TaxID=1597 RepID=UPI000F0B4DB7|nr:DUF4767 domain-containing protein [Lacticaseibacillus paracasei]RND53153.1 hypothetical protein FAM18121_01918 [Lacticaseibacillus paracasei]